MKVYLKQSLTSSDIEERETMCKDCVFRPECLEGSVSYCDRRDKGEPPVDAEFYDSFTGELLSSVPDNRDIYLTSDITKASVQPIIRSILEYNRQDKDTPPEDRVPIRLWIDCDGGEENAGSSLIDVIQQSLTPIIAIGVGCVYSMAVLVYIAAHRRVAFERSEYLIHDGVFMDHGGGVSSKVYDQIDFYKRRNDKFRDYILSETDIPDNLYDLNARKDWYMFADEAQMYGIVHDIVGNDVYIEELYE